MPSEEEPAYKVIPVGPFNEQIRDLHRKASSLGKHQEVADAFEVVVRRLQNQPLEWGDPQYQTRRPGGIVCQTIHRPLVVKYVVLEEEKLVWLLKVQAVSSSFLLP